MDSKLPIEPLQAFLEALLTHLPEDATPQVIVVKPEMPAPKAVRPNGQKSKSVGLAYDPSIVFVLELATILSARDPDTMSKFGKQLSGALQAIVRDAAHMHAVTVSRAVYYLLSFLRASHVSLVLCHLEASRLTNSRTMTLSALLLFCI